MNRIEFLNTKFFAAMLVVGLAIGVATACQKRENQPASVPGESALDMKPDRVARTNIAFESIGEISRLERMLKPVLGNNATPASTEDACVTMKTSQRAGWEINWKCGMDETVSGRKEIEGNEFITYDNTNRQITYRAQFEIRYFEDKEPRAKAYTLIVKRDGSVKLSDRRNDRGEIIGWRGIVKLITGKSLKGQGAFRGGTNLSVVIGGVIEGDDVKWELQKGAAVLARGTLYGRDGDRKTRLAGGRFEMSAENVIHLDGIGSGQCMIPTGSWAMKATGAAQSVINSVETSTSGGTTADGGLFIWSNSLCREP